MFSLQPCSGSEAMVFALNVDVNPEDIEISHKLNRKGVRIIIVKFQNHKVKSRLYKARTKLKKYPGIGYISFVNRGNSGGIRNNLSERKPHLVQARDPKASRPKT